MPLVRVKGQSMMPALRQGDLLWMTPLSGHEKIKRGDIVLVNRRNDPQTLYVKRIVGLPGERIECRGIYVWRNGQHLEEPYIHPDPKLKLSGHGEWQLKEGEWLVLGDTRDDSLDSRKFGPVHREELVAVARIRLWPPHRWRL